MKIALVLAALTAAVPAFAADPVAPVVPAPAAPAIPAKPSIDMTIEALMADPRAKAVIDADMPGIASHPMYESFKSMTLGQLAPMTHGKITDESLKKVAADLAAIK